MNKIEEKNRHYIRVNDIDLNTPLYRFISFETLLEIIQYKKLSMPKISCWEDPYENYFLKTKVLLAKTNRINKSLIEISNRLYGQCWTLTPESDAMWRIYSKEGNGVRISTTYGELKKLTEWSESSYDSICLGKVKYLKLEQIESEIKKFKHSGQFDANLVLNHTLNKRIEFAHENEFRIIYAAGLDFKQTLKSYDISDINNFIDSITFDPRISSRSQNIYSQVINELGYKKECTKSNLYDFNQVTIEVDKTIYE